MCLAVDPLHFLKIKIHIHLSRRDIGMSHHLLYTAQVCPILYQMRGKGIGKEIFHVLMQIAVDEGCDRLEWVCLNWNTPSIAFYKGMGAFPMSDWTTFRMTTKEMTEALERF